MGVDILSMIPVNINLRTVSLPVTIIHNFTKMNTVTERPLRGGG